MRTIVPVSGVMSIIMNVGNPSPKRARHRGLERIWAAKARWFERCFNFQGRVGSLGPAAASRSVVTG